MESKALDVVSGTLRLSNLEQTAAFKLEVQGVIS